MRKNKKRDEIDEELAASHHRVPITAEVRQALRAKRLGFGLSYTGAAELIGVHWSTYRKWEIGQTTKYTREIERRIQCFLEEEKPMITTMEADERSAHIMDKLINRLRNTYRLCQKQPRLQDRLTVRLENLLDEILSIYSQDPT
jgi:hypothetical protein